MTAQELQLHLQAYTEDECFYRSLYQAHRDPDTLARFLNTLDVRDLARRKLIVPELQTGYMPFSISDDDYFHAEEENSIVLCKHNRYTPAFRHKHAFFEMVYVLSGSCTQTTDDGAYTITEGQFCLLAPDTIHTTEVFDSSLVINILICRRTFEHIFHNILRDTNPISLFFNQSIHTTSRTPYLLIDTCLDSRIRDYVLSMFVEYIEQNNYYEQILNNELMILFAKILQHYEDRILTPHTRNKTSEICMKFISYMEKQFQTVTLNELASHFHYSAGYCSRVIKKNTGRSFTDLLQNIRFEKACTLLTDTNLSIRQISHLSGFEHVEHFNRLFRKQFQMTPGQYRSQTAL